MISYFVGTDLNRFPCKVTNTMSHSTAAMMGKVCWQGCDAINTMILMVLTFPKAKGTRKGLSLF
jgi:hypothetical protein